jgi:hypothetical protein
MLGSNTLGSDRLVLRSGYAVSAAALVILLSSCGGGGGSTSPAPAPAPAQQMTGTLSALPRAQPVAGATVRLLEIDSSGSQVGADIATAQTAADGSFTFGLPASFTPGPRYLIRALGTTPLDRLVTDLSSQDVDPSSEATKSLVLAELLSAGGGIQGLQRFQVGEFANQIAELVDDVDSASFSSTATLLSALISEARNSEEATSALGNLVAAGSVTGAVTDNGGTPLADIKIVARDFNQWIARAETRTDANGRYSLNLVAGDYIVGAFNFTAASMAASEWWTCNDAPAGPACGAANQLSAGKVAVTTGATTVDFKLEPGARVAGTITQSGATVPVPGVQLLWRDFANDQPALFQRARPDGTFRVNIRPGTYTVGARNLTRRQFAGGTYNGPATGGAATGGGGATGSAATPMTVAAGEVRTVDFPLIEGGVVRGLVTDGATPTPHPVAGIPVRFYATTASDTIGALNEVVRTNEIGGYRMWVRPGTYAVRSRGQTATPTVLAFSADSSPAQVSFGAAVGHATATLQGPGNVPLSQAKVLLYDGSAGANFQGLEASNNDGTVDVYAQTTGNYRIELRVDDGSTTVASAIDDGTMTPTGRQLLLASLVAFDTAAASPIALGTITLPAGGELRGVVTLGGALAGNIVVQLRSGGVGAANRFTNTRTQGDGSYSISVPAGAYARVCAFVPGTSGACPVATPMLAGTYQSANNVTVAANSSNNLDIAIP